MTAVVGPAIDEPVLVELVGEMLVGLFGEERGRPYQDDSDVALAACGWVAVSGAWSSGVVVRCSTGLVEIAANELLGVDGASMSEDDVRDIVGEFANVIGGNVKSMMPGPSTLSLPLTELGDANAPFEYDASSLAVDLTWCRQRIRVELTNATA